MDKITLDIPEKKKYEYIESYRSLRTNIEIYGKDMKVIGVTSTKPLEGKTSVAFGLAQALAQVGKKVSFIDGDMRKSKVASWVKDEKNITSIQTYFNDKKQVEDIIYNTNIQGLDIIFAGEATSRSTELLDQSDLSGLFFNLKTKYDHIIIDTPSYGSITDAAIILKECDGAVLVIEEDKVSHKDAKEVVDNIQQSQCEIIGVVINKAIQKQNINPDSSYYKVD
ncbi:MAG: CpsD/CapB family tyrosine-protein kinase [Eubacteriales bacterium]